MAFYFTPHGVLRCRELERWPWLVHGFSTRLTGSLGDRSRQEQFVAGLSPQPMRLATLKQIHSAIVHVADDGVAPGLQGDSLLAAKPGVALGVKTADCLPVLLVDPTRRAVGAVHAGWRGVVKRVVEKTVGEMRRTLGSDPADLHAAIGPGIQVCCFEVGPEVLQEFASQFADAGDFCRLEPPNPAETMLPRQVKTGGHALMRSLDSHRGRIDLAEAVRRQLLAAGVPQSQIYNSGLCTASDLERFYSYRKEKDAAGRLLSVIGVKGEG